jgi:hypothetical protein
MILRSTTCLVQLQPNIFSQCTGDPLQWRQGLATETGALDPEGQDCAEWMAVHAYVGKHM